MKVGYVCNTWPQLAINVRCSDDKVRVAQFEGGRFVTEDEELQEAVERNSAFGSSIHFMDDPSEARKKEEAEAATQRARVAEAARQQELTEQSEREANERARARDNQELADRRAAKAKVKEKAKEEVADDAAAQAERDRIASELGGK